MIRTRRRSPPPPELVANRGEWTARFKRILAANSKRDWATRRAKRILSAALYGLAHGKCVFCESPLEVSGDTEIEHYVAKTLDSDRCFEWTNLLPSCRLCNRAKGNQDHRNVLLKPDAEDPEPYFWLHPDTGRLEPHPTLDPDGRRRALETIRICNLQRAALCTKRLDMFARAGRWLDRLTAANGESDILQREWEHLSHPATEYKFVLRHVLRLRGQTELCFRDMERFEGR